MGTTADKLNLLLNSKADIKAALVEKGQTVSDVFSEYGDKIRAIQTGVELPALTNPASASEIGEGYEAINAAGERMVGTGELAVSLAPELTEQDALIAQISAALEGKMVPSSEPLMINFTLVYGPNTQPLTSECQAEDGMLWGAWVYSNYNIIGNNVSITPRLYVATNNITYITETASVPLSHNDAEVLPTDTILSGETYYMTYGTISGDCCFVAGTQVLTSLNGEAKNIEDFVAGDTVVSYNVETGENYIAEVKRLIIKTDTIDIAEVTFDNGTVITMNAYHPIYTENGWHSLTNYNDYAALTVGDNAKVFDGWSKLVDIKRYTSEPIVTYNLDVIDVGENPDEESNDTFYANGIVVHNGFC